MKRPARKQTNGKTTGLSRRDVLKTGATGAALAAGAGLGLFGGKAPAMAQERQVHVLAWSHFIPEADTLMKEDFAKEFKAATGNTLTYETVNGNDIPARATAAVESGTGPDIFQFQWNHPYLFANGLIDHGKLCAEMHVDKQYAWEQEAARVDGVFRGVPYYSIGNANTYRKDIFKEAGVKGVPNTWEEYLEAGKKLKKFGMPVGQTLGHTFGDAPTFTYPLLWAFGGREVDEKGKVAINSRETVFACEFLRDFWKGACDESGMAWDDSSNNRAFFAETISCTLNGASIYFVARYHPEKAPPGLADKIGHFNNPLGPGGRYHAILPFTHSIAKYSKNQGGSADFIRFVMAKKQYERYILIQKGYGLGATPDWENHPFWKQDPVVEPFRLNAKFGRNFGWQGAFNRNASEVQAKYIITDLFARVARGDSTQSAIAQTERELKNVYGA
jgi:multiple sugar transport system substrate-binding protein